MFILEGKKPKEAGRPLMMSLEEYRSHHPEVAIATTAGSWKLRRSGADGPALVMLPGCHGTADVYYKVAAALGRHVDVVTLTPPKHDDLQQLVSDLAVILDILKLREVALYGSSLGGYLAQLFAIRYKGRVRRLFLGNTFRDPSPLQERWPKPSEFKKLPAADLMAGVVAKARALPVQTPAEADLKRTLLALLGTDQTPDALKSRFLAGILAKLLPRVPLPENSVAIVDSDDDGIIPANPRIDLRTTYRSSPRLSVPGGGHFPFLLKGEQVAAFINRTAFAN